MVKYRGPRLKIIRRLGLLPGLTKKFPQLRLKTPGQHGKLVFNKITRTSLSDDYKDRLFEKQKLRFNYGITEKQLVSYFNDAKTRFGSTGSILLELIESRLDCVIFRLGFASTIPAARQIVNHGHIVVNNILVDIPSFLCMPGDIISIRNRKQSKDLITTNFKTQQNTRKVIQRRLKRSNLIESSSSSLLPTHLSVDSKTLVAKYLSTVKRKDVLIRINELKVVEYYSQ